MSSNFEKSEVEFDLYKDSDVGMGEAWFQDQLIETRMDDDAETDSGIYESALNQVMTDVEQADYLRSRDDFELGNLTICDRVAFPERYNRDGKLKRQYRDKR